MEHEGKYLEKYLNTLQKYLNTVIKYKLKNVFKYNVFKYCPALLLVQLALPTAAAAPPKKRSSDIA